MNAYCLKLKTIKTDSQEQTDGNKRLSLSGGQYRVVSFCIVDHELEVCCELLHILVLLSPDLLLDLGQIYGLGHHLIVIWLVPGSEHRKRFLEKASKKKRLCRYDGIICEQECCTFSLGHG